jgi:hypothetical protein
MFLVSARARDRPVFNSFSHWTFCSIAVPPRSVLGAPERSPLQQIVWFPGSKGKAVDVSERSPFSLHSAAAVDRIARLPIELLHPILASAAAHGGGAAGFTHLHPSQTTQEALRRGYESGVAPGQG